MQFLQRAIFVKRVFLWVPRVIWQTLVKSYWVLLLVAGNISCSISCNITAKKKQELHVKKTRLMLHHKQTRCFFIYHLYNARILIILMYWHPVYFFLGDFSPKMVCCHSPLFLHPGPFCWVWSRSWMSLTPSLQPTWTPRSCTANGGTARARTGNM